MTKGIDYLTGLITMGEEVLKSSFQGKGWSVLFVKHKGPFPRSTIIGKKIIPSKHLVIKTTTEDKAKEIRDLIYACWVVISGCDYIGYDIHDIYNFELQILSKNTDIFPEIIQSRDIYHAGIMAAKASFRESYIYAIHKLCFSYQTYAAAPIDLDPHQGNLPTPNLAKPFPPSIRIRIADAIISSYSAIEELGLDIQASESNPTKDNYGHWLPAKRNEIIARLKRANTNVNETFHWQLRGRKKIIEHKRIFSKNIKKSQWAYGPYVRDEEIDLVDAIDRASFLRSQIASHKFSSTRSGKSKLVKVLSIYDVANVQLLARRLILESLKLWEIY